MREVLIVPGWQNAGPAHWQSIWKSRNSSWKRVEQDDWENPSVESWTEKIDQYVRGAATPPIVVAHSLGCIALALWSARYSSPVAAAFLVAPADVESPTTPNEIRCFAPIETTPLPFPSLIVLSENDEFVSVQRASLFASWWGSNAINIGNAGHIGSAAALGEWPEGQVLFSNFQSQL
jgi:uncharacterized protein